MRVIYIKRESALKSQYTSITQDCVENCATLKNENVFLLLLENRAVSPPLPLNKPRSPFLIINWK